MKMMAVGMEMANGVGIIRGEKGKRAVIVELQGDQYAVYDTNMAQRKHNPFDPVPTFQVFPYFINAAAYNETCFVSKGAKVGHSSDRCHYATWNKEKAGVVSAVRKIDVIAKGGHLCKNCHR